MISLKLSFVTLGCKVNQYESQEIAESLARHSFTLAKKGEEAQIYIVNSCTVTAESDRKTRQNVRRLRQKHPDAIIVLTGCMPQAFPDSARELPADIIIGNKNNTDLPKLLEQFIKAQEKIVCISEHRSGDKFLGSGITCFEGHTRAFLKIQDGCDRFCSYCAIPYARGRSRSKPLEDIRAELARLAGAGYLEVVFVGINLSNYGRDINLSLADAVRAAQETEGIRRIRLGSLEPDHITEELLSELSLCDKLCPQFHISLQSGCNNTLKRMNRHYTAEEFMQLALNIRRSFRLASITTDIICGFPGETDEDFMQTLEFAKRLQPDKAHIFPYSPRSATRAASFDGKIESSVKELRCRLLSEECEKSRRQQMKKLIGQKCKVLFETPKGGLQCGYTENYTPVELESDTCLCGELREVLITDAKDDCVRALLI